MAIHPSQILFYAGGRCLELYGTPSRRVAPIARRGEDIIETMVRAGTGHYIDYNGELKLAEANALRIEMVDLDADGLVWELPTVLLEDTRTNLLLRSKELDDAAHTKTRSSVSADADTGPDGTTSADRLIEDATASSTHITHQDVTITADVNVAYSVILKAATRTWAQLKIGNTAGANVVRSNFDLGNGAKGTEGVESGTGSHVASRIKPLGNDFYLCTLVGSIGSGSTTLRATLFLATGDTTITYSGDGSSYIIVGEQQLEEGSFESSIITTVGSTVARAADDLSFPFHSGPQAGTFYFRFIERGTILTTNGAIFQIGASDTVSRINILGSGGNYRIQRQSSGTTVNSTLAAAPSVGDTVELVGQLNADGSVKLIQSINGAASTETAASSGLALRTTWSAPTLYVGALAATLRGFNAFADVAVFAGIHSMANCRTALQQ